MNSQPQTVDLEEFSDFLKEAGWGDTVVEARSGDAGLRRYFKLTKKDETALLMDMSRSGYEASLDAYITIGRYLREKEIHVPEIYHCSLDTGLSVIEDFGHESFGDVRKSAREHDRLYEIATDILIAIRERAPSNDLRLGSYNQSRIRERLSQFASHYMPVATGKAVSQDEIQQFQEVWTQIDSRLPTCPLGFCHADYHLENLMWRPDTSEKYGLIDFQDAFWGPLPYDLLNLLEDARVSVPEDIKHAMKDRYCDGMGTLERGIFEDWYVVLSAHFHCRVIGLFVKLYQERGMDQYLEHIPRLQGYIRQNLENPVLAPLKEFITEHKIALDITI